MSEMVRCVIGAKETEDIGPDRQITPISSQGDSEQSRAEQSRAEHGYPKSTQQ
jgi:hypothetical protein